MKREITLFTDGEIVEIEDGILVGRKALRTVGIIDFESRFDAGDLFVTVGALATLDEAGVIQAFNEHLRCLWWGDDGDLDSENNLAVAFGGTIYNIDQKRGLMCITYIGHETTLLLSEEY